MTIEAMKHTPAPWAHQDETAWKRRHDIVALGKTIARVQCTNGDDAEAAANARLIAAAPDLLDALRVAVDSDLGSLWVWPDSAKDTWMKNARTAITKATGGEK